MTSIRDYINAEIKQKRAGEVQTLPVPRMPRLLIKYRTLDDREIIRLSLETQEGDDPVQSLIDASLDSLIASSIGSESDRGEDLELPLGAALATFLGLGECLNPDPKKADREGAYLIFESERALVETASELSLFSTEANQKVAESIVKNSEEAVEETVAQ